MKKEQKDIWATLAQAVLKESNNDVIIRDLLRKAWVESVKFGHVTKETREATYKRLDELELSRTPVSI